MQERIKRTDGRLLEEAGGQGAAAGDTFAHLCGRVYTSWSPSSKWMCHFDPSHAVSIPGYQIPSSCNTWTVPPTRGMPSSPHHVTCGCEPPVPCKCPRADKDGCSPKYRTRPFNEDAGTHPRAYESMVRGRGKRGLAHLPARAPGPMHRNPGHGLSFPAENGGVGR